MRHPTFLNLHLLLWDSYIRRQMSSHQYFGTWAVEDRNQRAVTHLAVARSQKRRKRHFGFIQKIIWYRRFLKYRRSKEYKRKFTVQKNIRYTDEKSLIYKGIFKSCSRIGRKSWKSDKNRTDFGIPGGRDFHLHNK